MKRIKPKTALEACAIRRQQLSLKRPFVRGKEASGNGDQCCPEWPYSVSQDEVCLQLAGHDSFFSLTQQSFVYVFNYLGRAHLSKQVSKRTNASTGKQKPKRSSTCYTLYVQEHYESIKQATAVVDLNVEGGGEGKHIPSREILSILARQWAELTDEEKKVWRVKAKQMKQAAAAVTRTSDAVSTEPIEEGELPDELDVEESPDDRKPAARKAPPETDKDFTDGSVQV